MLLSFLLPSISHRYPNLFQSSPLLFYHFKTLLNLHTCPNPNPIPLLPSPTPSSHFPQNPHDPSFNFDPKTVEEAISTYSNDWKRALDFFNWVESEHRFQHTPHTYNRTIDVLGKFFEFDLAWSLIARMRKSPLSRPDHATFRIIFKRYASAHLVKEAVDAYNRSAEFGLKDEISFSNLIDTLCEYKHVIEAQDVCEISEFSNQTKMHNMILRGYFKMGWWSKCREIWEEMELKGVARDLHSYSIYMDIQCKAGKPWRAVRLYKELKKNGFPLDVVVYNNVVFATGLSEGADAAMGLYQEMLDFGCLPNVVTYNTIIKLLCREGRVKQAYVFLARMMNKGCAPDVITYHCFFRCLNRPKEILRLFERMIESGCRPRTETYVMLIKKFGSWGFLRPVFAVWDKMKEQGCSPDEFAYNALIDALVQTGMVEMAQKYEKEMLEKGILAKPRKDLGTKLLSEDSDNEGS
ncbi:hypothetical protein AAC387_Pa04g1178 [Persea americana]